MLILACVDRGYSVYNMRHIILCNTLYNICNIHIEYLQCNYADIHPQHIDILWCIVPITNIITKETNSEMKCYYRFSVSALVLIYSLCINYFQSNDFSEYYIKNIYI